MNLRVPSLIAGVLGGLCWVARWGAHLAGSDPGWDETSRWVGLGLLGLALAGFGASLVRKGAAWLRAIVAVAFPLLVWSVYAVLKGDGEGIALGGLLGIVAVALGVVLLLTGTSPSGADRHRHGHGAHSAR